MWIEVTEGMRFDRGFISPYFVTDVKSQKVEFEKPLILLSEKKISLLQDILPSLEAAAQQRRPLLIIAEDVDGEALAACILNKLRGQLSVCAGQFIRSVFLHSYFEILTLVIISMVDAEQSRHRALGIIGSRSWVIWRF